MSGHKSVFWAEAFGNPPFDGNRKAGIFIIPP